MIIHLEVNVWGLNDSQARLSLAISASKRKAKESTSHEILKHETIKKQMKVLK